MNNPNQPIRPMMPPPPPPPVQPMPQVHIVVVPQEVTTAQKVNKNGSQLEKDAVHAQQSFKRHGITVKDSRGS